MKDNRTDIEKFYQMNYNDLKSRYDRLNHSIDIICKEMMQYNSIEMAQILERMQALKSFQVYYEEQMRERERNKHE